MARITWSPGALEDLDDACRYIARDSLAAARAFARRVRAAVRQLTRCPESGRVVPEAETSLLRELIVGQYRVIYRHSPAGVEIATVLHGERLFRRED